MFGGCALLNSRLAPAILGRGASKPAKHRFGGGGRVPSWLLFARFGARRRLYRPPPARRPRLALGIHLRSLAAGSRPPIIRGGIWLALGTTG